MTIDIREIVDNNFKAHPDKAIQATEKAYLRGWFVAQVLKGCACQLAREDVEKEVAERFVALEAVCKIAAENQDKFAQALANAKLRGWFVGQAMRALAGHVCLGYVEQAVELRFAAAH
jgi:Asp-tRNA(Asn)/Glu-tRNA(Gln) amidotransferase B subunit